MNDLSDQLSRVSHLWLDTSHPLRQKTVSALQVSTGLSHRQIELALANCFEELSLAKIVEYQASLSPLPHPQPWIALHVLPANAFTAWVHNAVITLLLGGRCALKSSSREPIFVTAWKESIQAIGPPLAERVEIVHWEASTLNRYRAVIAYGTDETLKKIKDQLPAGVRFIGYGHKLSVGIVFEEAWQRDEEGWMEKIRLDAEPFRLQGCLSPQILYVENYPHSRWPGLEATLDNPPKVRAFAAWSELRFQLEQYAPYLSCVGYAGEAKRRPFLEGELSELGVSRVCPLGEMQKPPLRWQNDGIDLPNLLN